MKRRPPRGEGFWPIAAFLIAWSLALLLTLAFWGIVAWAIVRVVLAYT